MSENDFAEDVVENILGEKKKEHYMHGGEHTPQYYCTYCKRAHTKHSLIGREHILFRRE